MDKAIICHGGCWGLNHDTTIVYGSLFLSGTPPSSLSFSHAPACILFIGEVKKEGTEVKILAAPSVGQNPNIRVMYGRKGVKKGYLFASLDYKHAIFSARFLIQGII